MLEQQVLNGHTCYPLPSLLEKTASELLIDKTSLEEPLNQLIEDRLIHCAEQIDENGEKQNFITRIRYYRAEQRIAENIFRIQKS